MFVGRVGHLGIDAAGENRLFKVASQASQAIDWTATYSTLKQGPAANDLAFCRLR